MTTTDSTVVTLPAVDDPLTPLREYVPDFGEDEADHTVTPSATGEVKLTLRERSSGRDQITAVHTDGEQRDNYTFTVTDPDRRLCAYNRHTSGEVAPPHIRRALIEFGYHDTTGPPDEPMWFPEYTSVLMGMVGGCMDATDSDLLHRLYHSYLIHMRGALQAAYAVSRFESPAAIPNEIASEVFEQGTDSPLYGAESWDAIDHKTMQWELTTAEWQFDGSFLPEPPTSSGAEWGSYLFDEDGDRDSDEIEQELAEDLAASPLIPYITDPAQITGSDGSAAFNHAEGAEVRVEQPDDPTVGDYIRVIQYGAEGVTQHEFRITTLPGADTPGECVFESRDPDTALPPYPAVHAVTSGGYSVQNAPSFRLDATPLELVKNSYKVAEAVFNVPPVNEVFVAQLKMIQQPLVLLLYAIVAVDVAGAGSIDAAATAVTQEAVGKPVGPALDGAEFQPKQVVIECIRNNHPRTDAIETAYENAGISDRLHLDHNDALPELPA